MHRPAKTPRRSTPHHRGDPLPSLRARIDTLDRRIIALLNQRSRLVVEVGKHKRASGVPIYAPHREAEVLAKVIGMNRQAGGLLPDRAIEGVYRELMSGSFALELPLRVGYLGPAGSYSHLAAVRHFGSSVEFDDLHTIAGVFTEVARRHVNYGLAPIENSTGGGIAETLDAFRRFHREVTVYAEAQLEIHHALLADCAPDAITRIYSKPEVFDQCRNWLATQYPKAELIPAPSTAAAVKMVRDATASGGRGSRAGAERPGRAGSGRGRSSAGGGSAAIGSVLAGELYGLNPLFENIEDNTSNITRFVVIGADAAQRSGDDKTSIMFTTPDKPGALCAVLAVFDRAGVNLTHIDKRPSGRSNWSYTFFVDAVGHIADPAFAAVVRQVRGLCEETHVLGSYPRSKRVL